ncbi:hypothetical protein I4F81_012302 [Pyropia yezoensis]|uniref:Uncharacterized protein n=1 Tax=Pyropia yezoensis TaxID=2788 RepID=A0ACC3CI30_PYRYE|nr:hypothetical protein I4F81_012302 [Neopyropia yezoensis]
MAPRCAPRLAAAAAVAAAAVAAAVVVVVPAPAAAAVAAPRVPTGGHDAASRLTVFQGVGDKAVVGGANEEDEPLQCLPSLAPACDLGAHLALPSMEKCLPRARTEEAAAARSAFARIESLVAAARPAPTGPCCYATAAVVAIQEALVALAPAVRCPTGAPISAGTGASTNWGEGGGPTAGSNSVVIPGDDRLWCCDAQHYAPNDPAHRPCCVDGCYEMAATLGWLGYTLDSCCVVLNNREQYGRVCPAGTLNQVLVNW